MNTIIILFCLGLISVRSIKFLETDDPEPKTKCYVLALEGGGDKGAYQAGAIKGLVDYVKNSEVKWDVVTGISVGSLNGAGLSIYDIGLEKEASQFLIDTWKGLKGKGDIYQNWWLGPLYGLFYKTGLYDTTPLRKLVDQVVSTSELKREFVLGATNFQTGGYDTFDDNDLTQNDYTNAVLSSSAFPIIFPNIKFRNSTYMDGGVKIGVDIASGINKCLDKGYTAENVVIDVVLCNSKLLAKIDKENYSTLDVLIRYLEINSYDNAMRNIDEVKGFFPKANYRFIVGPTKNLPCGSIPLNFSPAQIDEMISLGLADAQNVVNKGEGVQFNEYLENYRNDRTKLNGRSSKKQK